MPRAARVKQVDAMYHIMVRSISEVLLYREEEDKEKYISFITYAQKKYYFKIYVFCLMDNHAHFILDPMGADLSKIMHYINMQYAIYYNEKYNRIGPVFQGRFKSEIIDSDAYFINASVYIHGNPKDLQFYKKNIQEYTYSSLYDYMYGTDRFGIIDKSFLSHLIDFTIKSNLLNYVESCIKYSVEGEIACVMEFKPEENEYRSERHIIIRDTTPKDIINTVACHYHMTFNDIYNKRRKEYMEFRCVCCYLMSCFCDISQKVIALILGNISQSSISRLIDRGIEYMHNQKELLSTLLI